MFWRQPFGDAPIVTVNLKDFPPDALDPYGILAQHPDDFVLNLLDLAPNAVVHAANDHRESLKKPPMTVIEYLGALDMQGLRKTASALRELMI